MALSVIQDPFGVEWPLGFVQVANKGTPVNIMKNVDANNTNAPGSTIGAQYTPTCHKVFFFNVKPGNNNNGMVPSAGYMYVLRALGPSNQNSGGSANRSDSGAIIAVVEPGGFYQAPSPEGSDYPISPYRYTIDHDVDGDGALVTLVNCVRG